MNGLDCWIAGSSTEGGRWELLLGVGGASAVTTRLGRPVRIGLCPQYITTNVDPELTEAVHAAAITLAKATGGEVVEIESPWTEAELEEVCQRTLYRSWRCISTGNFSDGCDVLVWTCVVPQLLELYLCARGRARASRSWGVASASRPLR